MSRLVAVILPIVFAACAGSPTSPSIDVMVTMPLGQTVAVTGTSVSLRFDAVKEDSRCPANAMCVWAGQAVVSVTIRLASREVTVELGSDPAARRTATAQGIRLEWVQLEPYPYAPVTAPPDYRVTLRVAR